MSTAMRCIRGVRPNIQRTECDCCRRPETLGHIMQVCPHTWGPRISRHDHLCSFVLGPHWPQHSYSSPKKGKVIRSTFDYLGLSDVVAKMSSDCRSPFLINFLSK